MNRFLHILLAALVFACPLLCAVASWSSGDDSPTVSTCCCQMPSQRIDDQQPAPLAPVSGEKPSQCICGGATLVDAVEVDLNDVCLVWLVAWQINADWTSVSDTESIEWNPPENNPALAISGRMLRQHYESWTL